MWPPPVISANPLILLLKSTGDEGENKKVTKMKGTATKKGKLSGNVLRVKNGITKIKLPIIMCRNLREKFADTRSLILLVTTIMAITYR